MWDHLQETLAATLGRPFNITSKQSISGGDINQAWKISDANTDYFLKTNTADKIDMFAAEAEGLEAMATTEAIRVPQPVCYGSNGDESYLVMEYLPLTGNLDRSLFGQQMAKFHQHTQTTFGWQRENTIGSTRQINDLSDDWIDFWRDHRLGFQIQLALKHGASTRLADKGERLMTDLTALFAGYRPVASILHGDLWSGNWGADAENNAVIFDPALYFGDHETDLAMMELFGSPGNTFFSAYNEVFRIDPGYSTRRTLYNLYHILNHFNLFRGGYAGQAEHMIDRLLAEIR